MSSILGGEEDDFSSVPVILMALSMARRTPPCPSSKSEPPTSSPFIMSFREVLLVVVVRCEMALLPHGEGGTNAVTH